MFIGVRGKISIDRGKFDMDPPELANALKQQTSGGADSTGLHLQNWIDCLKTRERPIADVEIGHRSATVCHLGNIARWVGRPLHWDPAREVFVDDAAANTLLKRERRKPYELPNPV
jgi:hypothetical protein